MRNFLGAVTLLTVSVLAFGQVERCPGTPQAASQAMSTPTAGQPQSEQSAHPSPSARQPQTVAGAALASKEARDSHPHEKVFHNKDIVDTEESAKTQSNAAGSSGKPSSPARSAKKPGPDNAPPSPKAFEAQGNAFKQQILSEKGKIARLQNQTRNLYQDYAAWSVDHWERINPAGCWAPGADESSLADWCAEGRNLKAAYDNSQQQLTQEKSRLTQMQEEIRQKGYGNGVYDPD